MLVQAESLKRIVSAILEKGGSSNNESQVVADHLVRANLAGHDSHGVIRTPRYVDMIKDNHIVTNVKPKILMESNNFSIVDGLDGYGHAGDRSKKKKI